MQPQPQPQCRWPLSLSVDDELACVTLLLPPPIYKTHGTSPDLHAVTSSIRQTHGTPARAVSEEEMGLCVSRSSAPPTAKVIGLDGSMAQLAVPVTTREALGSSDAAFLCISDELRFDVPPRALADEEALQPGWLYFVLPLSMLRRPISGQEMAALAVQATSALPAAASGKGRKTARVVPLVDDGAGRDGGWSLQSYSYGKNGAVKTVHSRGHETIGKTRKGAAGYGSGTRRRAGVQRLRLSAIWEGDGSE
uniref:Uncharacterized protein n=1 Tax=Avena sativa TaxID=4498 RepID=A0ACD5YDU0_AVESA